MKEKGKTFIVLSFLRGKQFIFQRRFSCLYVYECLKETRELLMLGRDYKKNLITSMPLYPFYKFWLCVTYYLLRWLETFPQPHLLVFMSMVFITNKRRGFDEPANAHVNQIK